MEYTLRQKVYLMSILSLYVILGVLGIFSATLIFLFPITAIPLTFYLLKYDIKLKESLILNGTICAILLLISGFLIEPLMYLVSIVVPSYTFVTLYKKKIQTPFLVMYVGIITIAVFYIYIIAMKSIGLDYVQVYMNILDEYKVLQLQMLDELSSVITTNEAQASLRYLREMVHAQVVIIQTIYPAIFILIGLFWSFIFTLIISFIAHLKKMSKPSIRDLGRFTFSKNMGILFMVGLLFTQLSSVEYAMVSVLGMNLFFLVGTLLEVLGFIVLIVLIKRSKQVIVFKIILCIIILLLLSIFPTIFMIIGLADTLFNFRKVEIVI